jgi:heat shock protein HslJ/membrane-bound inhibitor of C-type lysozyme
MSPNRPALPFPLSVCALLALAPLVALASPDPAASAQKGIVITGTLSEPSPPTLPPDGLVVLMLSDPAEPGAPLLAEKRIPLDGRALPLPFEMVVSRVQARDSQLYDLRAMVTAEESLLKVSEVVTVDSARDRVELGTIRLHRYEAPPLTHGFRCGDLEIGAGFAGESLRLAIGDRQIDLLQGVSASGARYVGIADPSIVFWNKGDGGLLELDGTSYPECVSVTLEQPPFRATGHEPEWLIEIQDQRLVFTTDLGATQIDVGLTEPVLIEGGRRYENLLEDGGLTVSILDVPCVDNMSGMPHPVRVQVRFDGQTLDGCGGDPASLLQGVTWIVEDIAERGIIDSSRVTIHFGEDGQLSGRASCNTYLGRYQLTGESLTLSVSGVTRMACPPALMDQETRVLDQLRQVRRFEIDPTGALLLHGDTGRALLARQASPSTQ